MRKIQRIAFPVVIILLLIISVYAIREHNAYLDIVKEAERIRSIFDEKMQAALTEKLLEKGYTEPLTVDACVELQENAANRLNWNRRITITVQMPPSFDDQSGKEQYNYLCSLAADGCQSIREAMEAHFPEYSELLYRYSLGLEKYERKIIVRDDVFRYIVKTSQNTYEYARYVKDYFLKNEEDYFVREGRPSQRSETSAAALAPSGKSSFSFGQESGDGDPYDVNEYTDPEDFWEDHEDEFEDFDDAWDYFEEHHR